MARVELAARAIANLEELIETHELPTTTKRRVKRSLAGLSRFPRIGPELSGRWRGFRYVFGPWRWMLIVYTYIEDQDRVVIVTVQDARTSAAATAER